MSTGRYKASGYKEPSMNTETTAETTANAWQAQLEEVRRRRVERGGGHAGLAKAQQVVGMTGLQVMKAIRPVRSTSTSFERLMLKLGRCDASGRLFM